MFVILMELHMHTCVHVECRVSWVRVHPRQLIFLRKSDCLECAVLLCLVVCLTLLASFFLLSSLIKTCTLCIYTYILSSLRGVSTALHLAREPEPAAGPAGLRGGRGPAAA